MSDKSTPPALLHKLLPIIQNHRRKYVALSPRHPAKISLRTYALGLLLSLGPALLPFVVKVVVFAKARKGVDRVKVKRVFAGVGRALKREFGPFGFAFAITTAVAGGPFLRSVLENLEEPRDANSDLTAEGLNSVLKGAQSRLRYSWISLSDIQRTFLTNALASAAAIVLLQRGTAPSRPSGIPELPLTLPISTDDFPRRSSTPHTLNLTLILFVRALDSVVHGGLQDKLLQKLKENSREVTSRTIDDEEGTSRDFAHAKNWIAKWTSTLDSLVFYVCSARIIWCFFYEPRRLSNAYVKWISRLAEVDPRIIWALRSIHKGSLSYRGRYAASPDLVGFSKDLGYPASWGDFSIIPAYGINATPIWRELGVKGRDGVGGIPCELVHGDNGSGNSCWKNINIRGRKAWLAALSIYLPAHLLPSMIKRPRDLASPEKLVPILLGIIRSATFLSAFVQLMWLGVCSTRTIFLARLFPWISHDYFDGPYGCIFVASLICGSSIWIENPRRRGEIALYVLPRAIKTVFSDSWLRSGRRVRFLERIVFVVSLSTLLTSGVHRPESLRGLSRWAVNYVLKGPSSLAKTEL